MKEIWKNVIGYEGYYEVSNLGNIRSVERKVEGKNNSVRIISGKQMTPQLDLHGYWSILLCKNGKKKMHLLHRLVAEAFVPNPNGYKYVNHKDEHRTNAKAENLEWCTQQYNLTYNNIHLRRNLSNCSKKIVQLDRDFNIVYVWKSAMEAQRHTNIPNANIIACCKRKRYTAGKFIWRYYEDIKCNNHGK